MENIIRLVLLILLAVCQTSSSNTFPTNLTDPPGSRPLTDKGSPIAPKNITSPPPNFPFQIDGCGAYTGDLVYVLSKAMAALNPALQDVELGNKSPPYQALFKYGDAYTYVRGVLRGIASVQTKKDLQPDPHFPSAPRFACVTPDTKRFYKFLDIDPYYECNQPESGQAFYWSGSSYIFLCPSFWIGPIEPVGSNCPPIYSNHWQGGGEPLSQYLTYLLIHEMVHFYLGEASLGVFNNPPEIYPINSCVSLDPLNSLHNPQNYQFYVALAQQGCSRAPNPFKPPFAPSNTAETAAVLSFTAANFTSNYSSQASSDQGKTS